MRTSVFIITAALLPFGVSILQADTIHVPSEQPTIQAGIDTAVDGDTVLVADGTYTGAGNYEINFHGKALVVMSENGPDNCIIDCNESGRGFIFKNGETSEAVVQGFTIRDGVDSVGDDCGGGGICCIASSSPMIVDNVIIDNKST